MIPKDVVLKKIKLQDLEIAPTNVRKHYVDAELEKLVSSFKEVNQSDVLYVVPNGEKYLIFKGQRRYLAAKKLMEQGKAIFELSALVFPTYTEKDQIMSSLVEDEHQKKIAQVDTAKACEELLQKGCSKQEIMNALGWDEKEFTWALSLLGSTEAETLEERNKENKTTPAQTIGKPVVSTPSISKAGTIDDPLKGLTVIQRSEVMARQREDPEKTLEEHAEEVKDLASASREIQGLSLKIELIDRFTALAKKTKSDSLRHEIEKFLNSEKTEEYLTAEGV